MNPTCSLMAMTLVVAIGVAPAQAVMIGHWKLDETSGITAVDSINGNNGTYVASDDPEPGWQTGLIGGAAGLNDEDDDIQEYFNVSEIPQMAGATQLSISIWFNRNDGPTTNDGNNGLFRARHLNGGSRVAGMNTEGSHIDARINGGNSQVDSADFSSDPGWHLAVMTWDSTDDSGGAGTGLTKIYIDGELSNSKSDSSMAAAITSSGEWWIGGVDCCGTTRGWTGALDDLAVWDEVLPAELVTNLYYDGLFGYDAATVYDDFATVHVDGDVTGDGLVNSADFDVIQQNFGQVLGDRSEGDLVNNNVIDLDDYMQWKLAAKDADPFQALGAAVPEPSSWLLLASAGILVVRCRRA